MSLARPEGDPLVRFREGDPAAFDELVRIHAPAVARFFLRRGVDAAAAEDLTQEVFLRLLRTRSAYESQGRLLVYLLRVARNVWLDGRRVAANRPAPLSLEERAGERTPPLLALLAHAADGPAEQLSGQETRAGLIALMARLSTGEREVLELALFHGLRYAEVARTLSIPEGTVKSRVFHAIRRLRHWITAADPGARVAADGRGGTTEMPRDSFEEELP